MSPERRTSPKWMFGPLDFRRLLEAFEPIQRLHARLCLLGELAVVGPADVLLLLLDVLALGLPLLEFALVAFVAQPDVLV